jgi:hypothetical protein
MRMSSFRLVTVQDFCISSMDKTRRLTPGPRKPDGRSPAALVVATGIANFDHGGYAIGTASSRVPCGVPATWRRSGADRASRPRAGRSVRVRTRPLRRWVRHREWPGRPARCRCVPGRQCRRSPPVRSWRAAKPRSVRAARRPRQRAAGSPAIGASVIPRRRLVVVGLPDRHRKPGGDRRVAGGRGLGLEPAGPRAGARSPAPRGPRIRPQPGSYTTGPARTQLNNPADGR